MVIEGEVSPSNMKHSPKNGESIFSPRFRSVAAMAGWDEEALLNASLVVEDTPDRDAKQKRRSHLQFKTPPTNNSRRKRRAQRKSPVSIPVAVLNLEDDETSIEESLQNKEEPKVIVNGELNKPATTVDSCSSSTIPCMDKLREELSCAICLEICYEPSTTSCGHSFCKKCLRSAADKCGKRCPKCRQLISNGRSCTINTVLWNTIQLLFPQEVETRKAASKPSQTPPTRASRNYRTIQALNSPEGEGLNLDRRRNNHNLRNRSIRPPMLLSRGGDTLTRRRTRDVLLTSQDEDAALAMRLQREEFMGVFRGPQVQQHSQSSFVLASEQHRRTSVTSATTNLRAMASRAVNIRPRTRQPS